jgi:hypothetical protein
MRRRYLTTLAVCAAASIGACSGDDEPAVTRAKATPKSPEVRAMLRNPDSAAAAVRRLWHYLQNGAILPAALLYHPEVRAALGDRDFGAVLAAQQSALTGVRPNVFRVDETDAGLLLIVEGVPQTGDAIRYSYLLQEGPQGWLVLYDTLMADAITRVITSRVQVGIDPEAPTAAPRAVETGNRAADAFREAALRVSQAKLSNDSP